MQSILNSRKSLLFINSYFFCRISGLVDYARFICLVRYGKPLNRIFYPDAVEQLIHNDNVPGKCNVIYEVPDCSLGHH